MAEMKNCTISELMGISKHQDFISNNELLWWQARSSMKPLPAMRADLAHAEDLYFACGKIEIKPDKALKNWYKKPVSEEEKWAEAREVTKKLQAELNEKNQNGK